VTEKNLMQILRDRIEGSR